jgi:hypothetical protein
MEDDFERYTGAEATETHLEDLEESEPNDEVMLQPRINPEPVDQAKLAPTIQAKLVDRRSPRPLEEERDETPVLETGEGDAGSEAMDLETPDLDSIEQFDTDPQAMDVDEPAADNTRHIDVTPPDVTAQSELHDPPQSEIPDVAPPELPDVNPPPELPSATPHLEETSMTQQSAIAELPLAGVRLWLDVGNPDIQDLSRRIKVSISHYR